MKGCLDIKITLAGADLRTQSALPMAARASWDEQQMQGHLDGVGGSNTVA
jgi:hypothetical protein